MGVILPFDKTGISGQKSLDFSLDSLLKRNKIKTNVRSFFGANYDWQRKR
jgi:hypothetical protein